MNVRLLINPDTDTAFVAAVHAEMSEVRRPAELESRLREQYPDARVTNGVREADGRPRWYVYRDGRWQNKDTPETSGQLPSNHWSVHGEKPRQ
jgi:hypothetical protein